MAGVNSGRSVECLEDPFLNVGKYMVYTMYEEVPRGSSQVYNPRATEQFVARRGVGCSLRCDILDCLYFAPYDHYALMCRL
jgi:hypothetical protein